jgi:hypothetical protein
MPEFRDAIGGPLWSDGGSERARGADSNGQIVEKEMARSRIQFREAAAYAAVYQKSTKVSERAT